MLIQIPRANIDFDVGKAICRIQDFNSSIFMIAGERMFQQMFHNPQQEWARKLVYAINWWWSTHTPGGHQEVLSVTLSECWADISGSVATLSVDELSKNPDNVFSTVRPILKQLLECVDHKHYSFASKFLHWASRGCLPMVDSRARKSINLRQRHWLGQEGHRKTEDTYVTASRIDDIYQDYKKWLRFYAALLTELEAAGAVPKLCDADLNSQQKTAGLDRAELIVESNTAVRILDKVFWIEAED